MPEVISRQTSEHETVRADSELGLHATRKVRSLIQRIQGGERLDFKVRTWHALRWDPTHP